jgi:protein-disulfide isomerase
MPSQASRRKRAAARPLRPWVPVAIIGAVAVIAVVLIIVISNVAGSSSNSNSNVEGATHTAGQNGTSVGSPDAPVTMVEYFRFDCIHCADFASKVAPQLEKDYVSTGKLRIEFHPMALEGDLLNASEAALAAGEQGHFWDYYDLVFANTSKSDRFSIPTLKGYAKELGLDTTAFDQALDSGKYKDQVVNETNTAIDAGLQATPTFYFGKTGEIASMTVPYSGMKMIQGVSAADPVGPFTAAIDALLGS